MKDKIIEVLLARKGFEAWWCDIEIDIQNEIKDEIEKLCQEKVDLAKLEMSNYFEERQEITQKINIVKPDTDGYNTSPDESKRDLLETKLKNGESLSTEERRELIELNTPKPYDKSKFKIYPTWKETREKSEISEEEFLEFVTSREICSGFILRHGFNADICNFKSCKHCPISCAKSLADIKKWMGRMMEMHTKK